MVDLASGYSLAVALITAMPETPRDSPLRAAARTLRDDVAALREAWTLMVKAGGPDKRAVDQVVDASWRSINWRLEAAALLSGAPENDATAAEAKALLRRLFPDGLAFTQLPYASQWAYADRLLKDIDEAGLARRIDALCGAPYLAFARSAHAAYGASLRITTPSADGDTHDGVREPLRRVQMSIQEYVYALFTVFPPRKPASVPVLRKALKPIDDHRAAQARSETPAVEPGTPGTPTPVAPPVVTPVPTDPIPDVL